MRNEDVDAQGEGWESDKNKKSEVRRGSSVFIQTSRAGGEIGGQKGGLKLAVSGDDRADQ
jgi:hypothetical protein